MLKYNVEVFSFSYFPSTPLHLFWYFTLLVPLQFHIIQSERQFLLSPTMWLCDYIQTDKFEMNLFDLQLDKNHSCKC